MSTDSARRNAELAPDPDPAAGGPPEMTEEEFLELYGAWEAVTPAAVRDLFAGETFRWWIAGGWAAEAASGRSRHHGDMDVVVLRSELDAIRCCLSGYHLWQMTDGSLRPLLPGDTIQHETEQVWVRRNWRSPWLMDLLLTPSEDGEWLFKRDHRIRLPLEEIGFTASDGVRYLRPEIVLLHKARLNREKDKKDLETLLPVLAPPRREWLAQAVSLLTPDHPWLPLLTPTVDGAR